MIGTTIGHYRILESLGSGSCGAVYKAQDTANGRECAIELCRPDPPLDDRESASLAREARLLSTLSHPNISEYYALEGWEGGQLIVREFIEGETLERRLQRGRLSPAEALEIALCIARGLEALHDRDVRHGNLTPAVVMLTPDGRVKLTGFGGPGNGPLRCSIDGSAPAESDEESAPSGLLRSLLPYLSPEQRRGEPASKRSDIWSFGCTLYELLSGRKAFDPAITADLGAAASDLFPDWSALPKGTPEGILSVLHRCLQPDPGQRLKDVGDARIEIEEARAGFRKAPSQLFRSVHAQGASRWRQNLGWTTLGLLLAAIAAFAWFVSRPSPESAPRMKFVIDLPVDAPLELRENPLALSPDGSHLVYTAQVADGTQLFLRPMDQLEVRPIPGTGGARIPFFSPGGEWIGYFDGSDSKLKKVPLEGGVPSVICSAQMGMGAAWSPDDTIVFAPDVFSGLWRVPAAGGEPQPLTRLAENEYTHRWPEVLPGGKEVLFTVGIAGAVNHLRTAVISLDTGARKLLPEWGQNARYSPSGHLVFYRAGDLVVVGFDRRRLLTQGPAVPLIRAVNADSFFWTAHFALSATGSIAYVPRATQEGLRTLVWVDREGNARRLTVNTGMYSYPRLSPDGRRLAVVIYSEEGKSDIWIVDVNSGAFSRLTHEGNNFSPVWSPDGGRVAFASEREGQWNVFWTPADGTGPAESLTKSPHPQIPSSWSADGRFLTYTEFHPDTGADIWVLSISGTPRQRPLRRTPRGEWGGMFSPDGEWVAYTSEEAGPEQVYVVAFPDPGEPRQISTGQGKEPTWGPSGDEIFYRYWKRLVVVDIRREPEFTADAPRVLFESDFRESEVPLFHNYDTAPDGRRFVMIYGEEALDTKVWVDLNCMEEMRRLSPPPK